jgi:hypothetical protein
MECSGGTGKACIVNSHIGNAKGMEVGKNNNILIIKLQLDGSKGYILGHTI